jgi:hypothetical protein
MCGGAGAGQLEAEMDELRATVGQAMAAAGLADPEELVEPARRSWGTPEKGPALGPPLTPDSRLPLESPPLTPDGAAGVVLLSTDGANHWRSPSAEVGVGSGSMTGTDGGADGGEEAPDYDERVSWAGPSREMMASLSARDSLGGSLKLPAREAIEQITKVAGSAAGKIVAAMWPEGESPEWLAELSDARADVAQLVEAQKVTPAAAASPRASLRVAPRSAGYWARRSATERAARGCRRRRRSALAARSPRSPRANLHR